MTDFNFSALPGSWQRWEDQESNTWYPDRWDDEQMNDALFASEQQYQENLIGFRPVPDSPTLMPSAGPSNLSPSLDHAAGYMAQSSAFALVGPPTESTFLNFFPKGNATLTYQTDQNGLESIRNVNIQLIEKRSPILALAFEDSRSGPQLFLEALTSRTALPFLRYLYTGSYALKASTGDSADFYEDVPTSLLFHCQLYRLAHIFGLQDLKSQAYVNVLRQCEFGCSSPDKPIDLCAAIRFLYEYIAGQEHLIDAILNYCVSCLHRLAKDEEFQRLGHDLRPFHQALCRTNMARGFENENAQAIVQMPFEPYVPATYASRKDIPANEFDDVFHFHCNDRFDNLKKRRRLDVKSEEKEQVTLPLRSREYLFSRVTREGQAKNEEYDLAAKRRASWDAGDDASTLRNIGQFHAVENKPVSSEQDYEIVEYSSPRSTPSDSDSDSDTYIKVKLEDTRSESLPIRSKALEGPSNAKKPAEPDSDSEWTLL